jgi:hypothetical protein
MSAFALADGPGLYHTYSTYARGVEQLMGPTGSWTWRRSVAARKGSTRPRSGGPATTSTTHRLSPPRIWRIPVTLIRARRFGWGV